MTVEQRPLTDTQSPLVNDSRPSPNGAHGSEAQIGPGKYSLLWRVEGGIARREGRSCSGGVWNGPPSPDTVRASGHPPPPLSHASCPVPITSTGCLGTTLPPVGLGARPVGQESAQSLRSSGDRGVFAHLGFSTFIMKPCPLPRLQNQPWMLGLSHTPVSFPPTRAPSAHRVSLDASKSQTSVDVRPQGCTPHSTNSGPVSVWGKTCPTNPKDTGGEF